MQDHHEHRLPDCAVTFADQLVRRIRYRKKVRQEVHQELVDYFEDELSRCNDDQTRQERANQLIQEFGDPRLLAALICRAKKRCRPLHVRLAIHTLQIFGKTLVYLAICILIHSIGRPRFSIDYLHYVKDLVSAGKEESINARRYYQEAVALLTDAMRWPSELVDSSPLWPADINEAQLAATARLVSGSEQALEAFERATELPDYWPQ